MRLGLQQLLDYISKTNIRQTTTPRLTVTFLFFLSKLSTLHHSHEEHVNQNNEIYFMSPESIRLYSLCKFIINGHLTIYANTYHSFSIYSSLF